MVSSSSDTERGTSMNPSTPVTVIWDFRYTWVPEGYDLRTLKTNIESALRKSGGDFVIEGKLIAVGHATGEKYRAITMLPDVFEFSPVEPDNIRTSDPEDQTAMQMVLEFSMGVLNRGNVLVISGNYDVLGAVNGWRGRGVSMMLALPESSDPSFYRFANVAWLWSSEDPEKAGATMVNGGGPIPPPVPPS